jgi:hypothetical protein
MNKLSFFASLLLGLALFVAPAAACPGGDSDPDDPDKPSAFCPGGDKDPDDPDAPSQA